MTENDVQLFKNLLTKKYQDEGHRVKSIEVKKGKFQNYYCLTSIAHLEDQQYLDGIPVYKKQFYFF